MDKKGKWIAEKDFAGIAGFHINALYSPWVRWEALIVDFLESRKNPEKLKVFWNTMLARSFEVRGEAPEWRRLYDGREKFPLRIVPAPACFVTGSADVQLNRIEVMAVAWARDKQNWTIDHRILEGDTAKPEVWRELDKYIHEEFAHETSGVLLPIKMFAIDSSYSTSTVYSWARKQMASKVMAIKGSASISMTVGKPTFVDVTTQGKRTARGLMLWPIGVSKIKEDLYSWLRLEKPLDGAEYPPCFCHFPEFDDEFFKQLTAEDLVKKVGKNKFAKYEWVKNRDRNEVLDLWVMARAAASRVGLDRMTDVHWAELERHAGFNLKKLNYVENIENPAQTIEEVEAIPSPPPQESYVLPRRKSEYW
jgi:phage terminase large subunit GpA-like protein